MMQAAGTLARCFAIVWLGATITIARVGAEATHTVPSAADSLSIADCARLAREQAPGVRIAALARRAARFDSTAAWRNRRPVVSLVGSALLAPRGFYDPAFTNLGDYELKLGLSLPLLDGGTAKRERARATNEVRRAAFDLDRSARAAAVQAADLAIQILDLRERAHSGARALAWLTDLAGILESRVRGGTSGPSELMRVALERDAVETELAATRTELAIAARELGQALGLAPEVMPQVRAVAPDEDHGPTPGDSLRLLTGVARLPEVQLAGTAEVQAQLDQADAEHRKAMRADLSADAGLAGTDLTTAVPPDLKAEDPQATWGDRMRRDLGASVSLGFNRPLLDATVPPTIEARRAAAQAAALQRSVESDTQRRVVLDLLDHWRSAAHRLRAQQGMVERAETNLLRVKSLYIAGATGLLDLLDARQILDEARARLAEARAENRMAQMEAETRP
jgi:outer membrane protein TolC